MALRAAIRVVVDADPDRRPARRDELPLVSRALAGQRGVDVGAVELVDVAAEDLDDLAAEHLVVALAEPVEERLVDEAVALVAVDVRDRNAQRVELALRQREQRVPLDGFADGVHRQVDAIERARKGHCVVCVRTAARPVRASVAVRRHGLKRQVVQYKQGSRPRRQRRPGHVRSRHGPDDDYAIKSCGYAVPASAAVTIRVTNNGTAGTIAAVAVATLPDERASF